MMANASCPTLRPSSSTASLVIEAVTIVPPTSIRTCAVVAPFFTSTLLPLRRLRALIFMLSSGGAGRAERYPHPSITPAAARGSRSARLLRRRRRGLRLVVQPGAERGDRGPVDGFGR